MSEFTREFQRWIDSYQDTPEWHRRIWEDFSQKVKTTDYLRKHRDYVVENKWGYGSRPFHWLWKLLVDQVPSPFSFMEIGVFKGQVISLIRLLADRVGKMVKIYGVSPLAAVQDKYSDHPDIDYMGAIKKIYADFNLSLDGTCILKGLSADPVVIAAAKVVAPIDVVYVDGGHDYETVLGDISVYQKLVRPGGFFILDDAGTSLNLPEEIFAGYEDVDRARKEVLAGDFKLLFPCGHVLVFLRTEGRREDSGGP